MTTSSAPVSATGRARIPATVWVLGIVSLLMDGYPVESAPPPRICRKYDDVVFAHPSA
ncbi:Major facilitator superfamily transporter [Agrobacterium tumefaciens]|nr:Major facilitator superfamily transporter [Agrobacterium tumefaciens]